jgi:hypothetical protein
VKKNFKNCKKFPEMVSTFLPSFQLIECLCEKSDKSLRIHDLAALFAQRLITNGELRKHDRRATLSLADSATATGSMKCVNNSPA